MDKREIQRAFDTTLKEIQFTPAHRRAVLERIQKEKRKKRVTWHQLAAVGVMAAALAVIVLTQMPHKIETPYVTTQGDPEFVQVQMMTMEEAIDIAKATLEEEHLLQDDFIFEGEEQEEAWFISAKLGEETHYELTVNNATGEAEITYRIPVIAQEDPTDEELEEQERVAEFYNYIAHMKETKGDFRFWSLEEQARHSELGRAIGNYTDQWSTMPTSADISEQEAIEQARNGLESKGKYTSEEVLKLYTYSSFLQDSSGKTIWRIIFTESSDADKGLHVDVPSKKAQEVLRQPEKIESEPVVNDFTPMYFNPVGGTMWHLDQNCRGVSSAYLPLQTIEDETLMARLKPCEYCASGR